MSEMSTEKQFHAAVNVIKGLPKDGPYQPSSDMKLLFYGLYKQATEGPCNEPKPAFYQVVQGYKWRAWSSCGEMAKLDAMEKYVVELKKIVETMSYSEDVASFMEMLGSFYEYVDLSAANNNQLTIKAKQSPAAAADDDGEGLEVDSFGGEELNGSDVAQSSMSHNKGDDLNGIFTNGRLVNGNVNTNGGVAGRAFFITPNKEDDTTNGVYNGRHNGQEEGLNGLRNGSDESHNGSDEGHNGSGEGHNCNDEGHNGSGDDHNGCDSNDYGTSPHQPFHTIADSSKLGAASASDTEDEYSESSESLAFCSGSSEFGQSRIGCDVDNSASNTNYAQRCGSAARLVDSSDRVQGGVGMSGPGVGLSISTDAIRVGMGTNGSGDTIQEGDEAVAASGSSGAAAWGGSDVVVRGDGGIAVGAQHGSGGDDMVTVLRLMQGDLQAMTQCLQGHLNDITHCLHALNKTSLALQTRSGSGGGGGGGGSDGNASNSEVQTRRQRQWWPFPELSPRSTFWLLLWPIIIHASLKTFKLLLDMRKKKK